MFIEFQIGNFRSFRDLQKFTMQAAPLRSNDIGLEEGNVFICNGYRLLKSKAVYGANASGKSNLGKAISAFVLMVSRSVSEENLAKRIWEDRFQLLKNWESEPIFFQYSFVLKETIYRYGFQIKEGVILYEWLFGKTGNNSESEYFMRSPGNLKIEESLFLGSNVYMNLALSGDNELFRPDSLFLTGASLNGNNFAASLRNEIRSIISIDGIDDYEAIQAAMRDLDKGTDQQKTLLKNLIQAADTGITDLKLLKAPDSLLERKFGKEGHEALRTKVKEDLQTLFSFHLKYDDDGNVVEEISVPFEEWESTGTAKLLGTGALILRALREGRTILIDEFDAQFHPNLTLKIVQLFNSPKTNPFNAQLIIITHDSSLMRRAEFRRDQICLINKDRYGVSSLRSLIEYKGVRKDASYEKEYLNGNYDAVPYLNEIDWQIIQNLDEDGL